MNTDLIKKVEQPHYKKVTPKFQVGDTVEVSNIIREGDKQRTQKFKGLVIAIRGAGTQKMFTVRKISYGVGVEKIFPIQSPNVSDIVVIKNGDVRRSKLYYMRKRVGRSALKVKAGEPIVVEEHADEAEEPSEDNVMEPVAEETAEVVASEAPVAEVEAPAEAA